MPDTSTVLFLTGMAAVVVAARYLLDKFAAESAPAAAAEPRPDRGRRIVTDDMVTVVQTIVPQWDRDSIRRDLEETHSIEGTTTRLLAREPPVRVAEAATSSSSGSVRADPASANLLRRYGLDGSEKIPDVAKGYQEERRAREEQLRLERQAMVIKARQRVLEMEREKMQH